MISREAFDLEHLLRELAPQVLGALVRRSGDFAAAEDALQEALIAAAADWQSGGVPVNPRGWLYRVATRKLIDQLRSELARRRREQAVAAEVWAEWAFVPTDDPAIPVDNDDTLVLLFMCCHPALTAGSAIALTLRAVGGLTTAEIAKAFFVPEATMAQRISRAKQTIKASRIPFTMPGGEERTARLNAVLHVLYLIFNEGYAASGGSDLQRTDLAGEAIRLTRAVRVLLPSDPEVAGLLALMLLTDARRAARTGSGGELIPLDEQDRALWDRALITEGTALINEALTGGAAGYYHLQAAIAATHDQAARAEDTDWKQIVTLYELLMRMSDNPMIALSHAIAVAMVRGPQSGLALIDGIERDARLSGHFRIDAVRAHLLERLGERESAIAMYQTAADKTTSTAERNYLLLKAARLRGTTVPAAVH